MATSYKEIDITIEDELTAEDCSVVSSLLLDQVKKSINNGNPLGKIANIGRCSKYVQLLKDRGGLNVFKDSTGRIVGAIAFSKCDLWFSDAPCLCEEFVLSIPSFSGMGRLAVTRFDTLADIHCCKAIASGNLLSPNDNKIENLYMRKGEYDLKVGQFIKVL